LVWVEQQVVNGGQQDQRTGEAGPRLQDDARAIGVIRQAGADGAVPL
jgi:hypothetical protein